ncbi:MAG: hypothetical protein NT074_01470 [Methanomicrobiales archaeon]|nr:hypothetical protein [Methanomicrobiales archaeon]
MKRYPDFSSMACDALTRIGTPAIPKVISASKNAKRARRSSLSVF